MLNWDQEGRQAQQALNYPHPTLKPQLLSCNVLCVSPDLSLQLLPWGRSRCMDAEGRQMIFDRCTRLFCCSTHCSPYTVVIHSQSIDSV